MEIKQMYDLYEYDLTREDKVNKQKNIVSERLEAEMKRKDVTGYVLAKATGVTQASISQYLNEKNIPGETNARKLARYFGVDFRWLMGDPNATYIRKPHVEEKDKITKEINSKIDKLTVLQKQEILEIIDSMLNKRQK